MADNEDPEKRDHAEPRAAEARSSEWTASDERGPLGTAEEERAAAARAATAGGAHRPEAMPPSEPYDAIAREHVAHEASVEAPASPSRPEFATPEAASPDPEPIQPEPVPPEPVPLAAAAARRPSYWPVAAAIVLGAIVGAGSAYILYGSVGAAGPDPQVAALAARVDALEKRPDAAALKASVAELDRKVAAMGKVAAPGKPATPAGADATLQKQVAALDAKVEALTSQGQDDQGLQAKVAALERALAAMRKDASQAQASVADVAGQQRSMASAQKTLADKVMVPALAVVADSLVRQIDQGEPYATQVAALETLGADPAKLAVLKQNADKGVASAKTLAARFVPLGEQASASAVKAPANAGFLARLQSGMSGMISVRAADDTSGTDLPSRVARIKADLAHDDVAAALASWNALPADARTKGEDWALLAKAHVEAMSAAFALQHDAIAALGARKS